MNIVDDDESMAQNRKSSRAASPLIQSGQRFCNRGLFKMRNRPGLCIISSFLILVVILFLSTSCLDSNCGSSNMSNHVPSKMISLSHVLRDNSGTAMGSMSSNPYSGGNSISGNGDKLSFDQLSTDSNAFFDIKKFDVIVFLHIQKTGLFVDVAMIIVIILLILGGTKFGRHLVHDLILESPCQCKKGKKRCKCVRPSNDLNYDDSNESNSVLSSSNRYWLFSRYSMGWKCGLHADWTELTNCVDNAMDESEGVAAVGSPNHRRRYFYITLLRDPVARFISEWKHVQRGATWRSSRHWCSGRVPTNDELPPCYPGQGDWRGVTLDDFMACNSNLAINRQTRMLADLTLVGCYNKSIMSQSERDTLLLASAKDNLRKMAYYGVVENQTVSQYLFEATFKLNFKSAFVQLNQTHSTYALNNLPKQVLDKIKLVNHLDVQLYEYAWKLLKARFEHVAKSDGSFDENWKRVSSNSTEVTEKKIANSEVSPSEENFASLAKKKIRHDAIPTVPKKQDEGEYDQENMNYDGVKPEY